MKKKKRLRRIKLRALALLLLYLLLLGALPRRQRGTNGQESNEDGSDRYRRRSPPFSLSLSLSLSSSSLVACLVNTEKRSGKIENAGLLPDRLSSPTLPPSLSPFLSSSSTFSRSHP